MPPEDLGRILGIDLADPGFWDRGLDLVERQLEAAEAGAAREDRPPPSSDECHLTEP